MTIYTNFIHFTGCILNKKTKEYPRNTFSYLLSTESSFFSEMLFNYWNSYSIPYMYVTPSTSTHLMTYIFHYLPTELPITPFYIENLSSNLAYSDIKEKTNFYMGA